MLAQKNISLPLSNIDDSRYFGLFDSVLKVFGSVSTKCNDKKNIQTYKATCGTCMYEASVYYGLTFRKSNGGIGNLNAKNIWTESRSCFHQSVIEFQSVERGAWGQRDPPKEKPFVKTIPKPFVSFYHVFEKSEDESLFSKPVGQTVVFHFSGFQIFSLDN